LFRDAVVDAEIDAMMLLSPDCRMASAFADDIERARATLPSLKPAWD
jgi:hypothetical protein